MKHHEDLLRLWRSRTGPADTELFSEETRERVVTLFLRKAALSADDQGSGEERSGSNDQSTVLVSLGIEAGLSVSAFCAELHNCQLSLLEVLTSNAVEVSQQETMTDSQEALQSLARQLASMGQLINHSAEKFMESEGAAGGLTTSPDNKGKPGKTLQHEIRTPLQGALLTTELMLEDAGHGDPVSADDILAVRKSIETAVGILNDFASRST